VRQPTACYDSRNAISVALLERNAAQLILIVNGRGRRAAVPVVPQSLSFAAVTADTGSAGPLYDREDAAFMPFQPHESGIHAVLSGTGEASVTEVRFRRVLRPTARRERTTINLG
jgi:hypothetical protein